ncbi:MAG: phosphoribosylaminoimidazolesuccinocarboxamide synthase [bacterium]|nr:phosphoribosylaminoimidazolesuccinocarboxamide synthase [bacterium]
MTKLPPARSAVPLLEDLKCVHRGKVRDTYDLGRGLLLVVATDAISIFDFVLNALVPQKGAVLAMMSVFWFRYLERCGFRTHLVAAGADIDQYVPEHLRGNADLQCRAIVAKRLAMIPVEFIARGYFVKSSSSFAGYPANRTICGHELPEGLQDGDEFPSFIDTPTTKAEVGHDAALNAAQVRQQHSLATVEFLLAFGEISRYAREKGIIIADGKGELGEDECGNIFIGDEFGTPDCCRFWDAHAWQESQKAIKRTAPVPFDKQLVRAYGIEYGVNKRDPLNPDDVALAHGVALPNSLLKATTQTYRYIFWRLVGKTVEQYAHDELGVHVPFKKKKVAVVFGSESDIPPVLDTLKKFKEDPSFEELRVHVISCHRNPGVLENFALGRCQGADVVVAAGGKAFALAGVLDAWLHWYGSRVPVVGVALGGKGPDAQMAAIAAELSIMELPGQPVVMKVDGDVYSGTQGFAEALEYVARGELPPPKVRQEKPALLDIDLSKY